MFKPHCPHCGFKLGQFLYADACPECRQELQHNTRRDPAPPRADPNRVRAWPVRWLRTLVRLVES